MPAWRSFPVDCGDKNVTLPGIVPAGFMMDSWLFLKSALIGLAVAAPVGPMGLLCVQRTLARGQLAGLTIGAGVAAADCSYAAIAAFGVTAVSGALMAAEQWIRLAGSLLLIYLGLKISLTRPGEVAAAAPGRPAGGHVRAFLTAYGLTLTNLPTIVFFAGIFASIGAMASLSESLLFSGGVLAGSLAWWLILTTLVRRGAAWFTPRLLLWLNRGAGVALVLFGVVALAVFYKG
jgi:threonine/homoserine/homoserine lactone efflux protein